MANVLPLLRARKMRVQIPQPMMMTLKTIGYQQKQKRRHHCTGVLVFFLRANKPRQRSKR